VDGKVSDSPSIFKTARGLFFERSAPLPVGLGLSPLMPGGGIRPALS